jgi:hypothetical protein
MVNYRKRKKMKSENLTNINFREILVFVIGNIKLFIGISIVLSIAVSTYLILKPKSYIAQFNFQSSQVSNLIKKTNLKVDLVNLDHYTDVELNIKNPSIYTDKTLVLCGYPVGRSGRVDFVKNINSKVSPDLTNPMVEVAIISNDYATINDCIYSIFDDYKNAQINNFINSIKKKDYDYFTTNPSVSIGELVKTGYFVEAKFAGIINENALREYNKNYIKYLIIIIIGSLFIANSIGYLMRKKI